MENVQAFHDTFTIDRLMKARISRVFDAFCKLELKSQWFIAPAGYKIAERSLDFRVGGREILRGQFPNGTATSYDATFYEILENQRIIYAYDLLINGKRFSVTLATVELREENGGTRVLFTEQNIYLNAPADANQSRIQGVSWHLENLEKLLEQQTIGSDAPCPHA